VIREFLGLLACLLLGHRPGAKLYRYQTEGTGRYARQNPATRGATSMRETGWECVRCGARKEPA